MDESKIDAESVTRNKSYGAFEHLQHLVKIGWKTDSPLIKKFIRENYISEQDLNKALESLESVENNTGCLR